MKLGSVDLNNTDEGLIVLLGTVDRMPADALARAVYPKTKQLEKKAATYTRALKRLQRFGYVREIGKGWTLTAKGWQTCRKLETAIEKARPPKPALSLAP